MPEQHPTPESPSLDQMLEQARALYAACHKENGGGYLVAFCLVYRELLETFPDPQLRKSMVFHVFSGSTPDANCVTEPLAFDATLITRVRSILDGLKEGKGRAS